MVDVPLPRGQCGGGGAFAFPKEQGGSKGQIAEAGAGEEEGFAFAQGDEQQVDAARLVPEPAFAVAAGGGGAAVVVGSEGGEHFGAHLSRRSAAMHAQRCRLGPRQRHASGSGNQWRRPGRLRPTIPVNKQLGKAGRRWHPNGYANDSIRWQPLIPHRASTKCKQAHSKPKRVSPRRRPTFLNMTSLSQPSL